MPITPTIDLFLNYNNPSQPVLISPASIALARGMQVTGGEKVTLNVYLVDTTGPSPTYVLPEEGDSIRYSAKKQVGDSELAYFFDTWTIETDHVSCTADFATVEGFWASDDEPARSLISNFEIQTAAGLIRKWSFFTQVIHQSYGGEAPPVNPGETFVKYTEQTPTELQKAQARDNIGAGTSSFDPASPGPIGGTTPGEITTTNFTLGAGGTDPLIVGDVNAGTVTYMGGHNFRQGANFGSTGQATIDSSGVGTFPSISATSGAFTNVSADAIDAATIEAGTLTATSGASVVGGFQSDTISATSGASVVGGFQADTISAASGTFTVGAAGNVNGAHFKANGTGGEAGHNVLKQGTTPSGTASYTTLWGISGGIGWRDGTGTAYSLTMPTASGTLALVSGALGTPTSITLTNATGIPLTGLTGTLTPAVDTVLSPNATVVIQPNESAWTATTISGAASFSGYNAGCRFISLTATTAGLVRHLFASQACHLPGTNSVSGYQVNWDKSWTATWAAINACAVANGTIQSVIFGCVSTQANHTLTSKGVRVTIEGNGTNVRWSITAYASSETTSSVSVVTTNDSASYGLRLEYTAAGSFKLYRNGTLLCTLSTGLPSGLGTATHNNIALMATQLAGSATAAAVVVTSITINHF